ncbi:MAG: DUF1643 domain-containing protein [Wenzhouxiangella sp.]|jgi:hypothetical protein|nr:DUF1643 domain-containing protein [Wenzhouxiangella sp.]MDR9452584.1 DUF1643 domain-containing protein [Wenzhouxiangella sp.]
MQHPIPFDVLTTSNAVFSECGRYRYSLQREWAPAQKKVVLIGLNPSTADATANDPTIRRCIDFARRWGFGGLVMLNLFAYRATDPEQLKTAPEPIGPDNDEWIRHWVAQLDDVVAVWGNHGTHQDRDQAVKAMCGRLSMLKLNRSGQPAHPLYLPSNLKPKAWI